MAEHDGGTVPPNTGSPTGTTQTTTQTAGTGQVTDGTGTTDGAGTAAKEPDQDPLSVDIKASIQRARQEEKDKLYSRMTQTETEAKAVREALAESQAQIKTLNDALNKLNAEGAGGTGVEKGKGGDKEGEKGEGGVSADDIQRAIDAAARTTLERAEKEIFGPKLAALEEANRKLESVLATKELDAYKNSLIEKNKDAIIPELVVGTTTEELDNALVMAKQAFAKVAQTLTSRKEDVATQSANQIPPLPSLTTGNTATSAPATVSQLTDQEYAEKRAALLREASEQVRSSLSNQPLE